MSHTYTWPKSAAFRAYSLIAQEASFRLLKLRIDSVNVFLFLSGRAIRHYVVVFTFTQILALAKACVSTKFNMMMFRVKRTVCWAHDSSVPGEWVDPYSVLVSPTEWFTSSHRGGALAFVKPEAVGETQTLQNTPHSRKWTRLVAWSRLWYCGHSLLMDSRSSAKPSRECCGYLLSVSASPGPIFRRYLLNG